MAKIYGLNGALRGRQGNNVFSIQSGTQVVKAYQPVVGNPRTAAQQIQRAKFALAGKIAGFTPPLAVSGMRGTSLRSRRGEFVSGLVSAASVEGGVTGYTASIPFASMLFSRGGVADWSQAATFTAVMATSGTITVTVTGMTVISGYPTGYRELLVVGMFDANGSPLDRILSAERSSATSNTFRFHLNTLSPAVVAVWKCPFVPSRAIAGVNSSNVGVNDGNTSATLTAANTLATSNAEWGDSILMGTVAVTVPSRDDDHVAEEKKKK